jgi:hypothetical protein
MGVKWIWYQYYMQIKRNNTYVIYRYKIINLTIKVP